MEVAGQWRRQWAGTAEYGKVTEGGVTRQVARAMEVLQASGPGAAVRVVRAAYHSSAGPGAPASSYLVHSSRRMVSSGFNFLERPTFPSRPLEISSSPFESNENTNENITYKVTEPDDTEISEPSKWRGSTAGTNSIRLPSEESSSTADNTSIIDLDWRSKASPRKSSCDSESSELQFPKRNSIDIPIQLSPPETLRTLKYKSLLNNNNDWNDRRQSYSFEDTSPINETILHANDTLAMESSTDSGICKSSELIDEPANNKYNLKSNEESKNLKDISFKDWLSRNRNYPSRSTTILEHENVALRSSRKVSITVPITIEKDDPLNNKANTNEDVDRKVKRVEFCKTELHFAAESGKVNIIATDEKPPPSNDFRKRRSAFVPLNENFEKPVTLFGDKSINNSLSNNNTLNTSHNYELTEHIENTAATKSILKNKIPKPKPYLLGENMEFGLLDNVTTKDNNTEDSIVPSAVLLINKQLQEGRLSSEDIRTDVPIDYGKFNNNFNTKRTINTGSIRNEFTRYPSTHTKGKSTEARKDERKISRSPSPNKSKMKMPQTTSISTTSKSRPLRETELIYFGVEQKENKRNQKQRYVETKLPSRRDDEFKSVKLIQKVSNSVCNSDNESESQPEYQNLSINKFTPVPAPRTSILLEKPREVMEEECISKKAYEETRRSRLRGQENGATARSISEPPKRNTLEKYNNRSNKISNSNDPRLKIPHIHRNGNEVIHEVENPYSSGHSSPTYVNLPVKDLQDQIISTSGFHLKKVLGDANTLSGTQEQSPRTVKLNNNHNNITEKSSTLKKSEKLSNNRHCPDKHSIRRSRHRTEKLQTPDITNEVKELHGSIKKIENKKMESDGSFKNERDEAFVSNKAELPIVKHREHREKRSKSCNNPKDSLRSMPSVSNKNHPPSFEPVKKGKNTDDYATNRSSESVQKTSKSDKYFSDKKDDTLGKHKTFKTRDKLTAATKGYDTKNDKHRSYKKSEYIINYDDKNGTVSSVCKIRPTSASSKKMKIHKESNDIPKASDRISLLQLPDRDWIQNDYNNVDRRSYRKKRMQRTCQLL